MTRKRVFSGRRTVAICLLAAVNLTATAISANAQQFSAGLVTRNGDTLTSAGTLRVRDGKARIEAVAFPDGFFLVDPARPAAYFVRPNARVFMDAMQSSPLTRMFVAVDPDNPCRHWQAMAQLAAPIDPKTWRCERSGTEAIAGRNTDVYRVEAPSGLSFIGWVDREHGFPLQVRTADGTVITVDQIRDEPQMAQLFESPAGLRKFDPQALIRQIKQSDVWVAPPASE